MGENETGTAERAEARESAEALPGFDALGLDERLLGALTALGYEEPTPIQREAIPPLLQGRDLLGMAATGTGKTAAFALPLLHRLSPDAPPAARTAALILVPTRELAMQVAEAVHRYGKPLGVVSLPIYGGASMETQLRALRRGVDVVVATPGRALDHIRRGSLKLDSVRVLVLDEADEMLDMGFAEDLEAILAETPAARQTMLFSATIPRRIAELADAHLKDPVRIRIDREMVTPGEAPRVRQVAYVVARPHKMAALGRILDMEDPTSVIVFCRTRTEVDELAETLNARGYRAEALHGGLSQEQRDRVMRRFRSNASELLIATDVAARGLDVEHVSHVVNYDVPAAAEAYVHRIGRTGRAGREGVAITLAEPREHRLLRNIERLTRQTIDVAPLPTVADLRARRLELAQASLRETLLAGELDHWRVVVESLAEEFDLMDIAAAAVKQADVLEGGEAEEIPAPSTRARRERSDGEGGSRSRPAGREFGDRGERSARSRDVGRAARDGQRGDGDRRERAKPRWEVARLYIGAGRKARVRPGDIVGAIANEAGIDSSAIGAIRIEDRYSLVEVPEEIAEDIIAALGTGTIRGKRVTVRRDRD
ncbi:MAG TPA: DEAD/DEAH box helicase [Gemmatimonadaceae bacterium]|nr:DEAD/DEAH box helicase [Gemmatimonadaceae bacterium]